MFILVDKTNKPVLTRNGEPFIYTTPWTAELGRKFLTKRRGKKHGFRVVEVAPTEI